MIIEAVETQTCTECEVVKLCARLDVGPGYDGTVCLECVCKAFGVVTPPGPYTPWQQAPLAAIARDPAEIQIDHTATISPELQAELDEICKRATP